tara:strand:- start:182 stop:370 length:189 start_codon:yes stop_codon:yes gene_type:complete
MEDMTYRMIEHITKRHSKTVLDFLTAFALQEYQAIEKKPHHRILRRWQMKDENSRNYKPKNS